MATIDRDILTIVEPTIQLDEVFVEDGQSEEAEKETLAANPTPPIKQQSTEGGIYPMIQIGSNKVSQDDLENMTLELNSFIPTMNIEVSDSSNKLSSIEYPLDGTVVSLYLKPTPVDEYRPIRIDFDILNISSQPADPGGGGIPALYNFECQMKVPLLTADVMQGFASGNSFDHLIECAEGLGLGFASNEDGTDDAMPRICAQQSREEFIELTTLTAYKDDESFFTSYIDPHYYLCMVNVNKQFSEIDEMETVPVAQQMPTDLQNNDERSEEGDATTEGSLRLTNDQEVAGSDMSISSYNLVNNSGAVWTQNGYARRVSYVNLNENNNGGENNGIEEFLITPLNTPGTENDRIPLRGRVDEDYWKDNNKVKYLGKQTSEEFQNMHSNYFYAIGNNYGNMDEIEKMVMEIELEVVNWSLYRYQRVPVIIYNTGEVDNKKLADRDERLGEAEQPANANTPEDEAAGEYSAEGPNQQVKNEFLSGYYVISEITYTYNKETSKIQQQLKLLRREWPIPAKNKDN
jgi:hypothetical protein